MISIKNRRDEETMYLSVRGVLDYTTSFSFLESVGDLEGIERIVIDFKDMVFIDSTGIGSVIDIIRLGAKEGIKIEFVHLTPFTEDVFETVGVFKILQILTRER